MNGEINHEHNRTRTVSAVQAPFSYFFGDGMNYIEYREGKVYDQTHLRPFDLELARQGHPLATWQGNEVRCFREDGVKGRYQADWWCVSYWACAGFSSKSYFDNSRLRLAPLAVKDGKPLHVGDVIEIDMIHHFGKWVNHVVSFAEYENGLYRPESKMWRWPEEKAL